MGIPQTRCSDIEGLSPIQFRPTWATISVESFDDLVIGPVTGLSLCEMKSDKYCGAFPLMHLKTYIHILKFIRSLMGSQWSVFMRGAGLSSLLAEKISLMALCWRDCRRSKSFDFAPYRRALPLPSCFFFSLLFCFVLFCFVLYIHLSSFFEISVMMMIIFLLPFGFK